MAYVLDPQIEHLLRRAGFGARPDELDAYRAQSFNGAVTRLLEYERHPRRRRRQDRQAGLRRHDDARRFSPQTEHRPTRGSDGCSGWCTPTGRSRRR